MVRFQVDRLSGGNNTTCNPTLAYLFEGEHHDGAVHPGYGGPGVAGYAQGEVAVVDNASPEGGQEDVVLALDHVVQSPA